MQFDFLQSLVVVFIAVILFVIGNLLLSFRKRKVLERKVQEYQKLLRQGGQVRHQYLDALKDLDEIKKRLDTLKEELTSQKIRLLSARADVRKLLSELDKLKKESENDKLRAKTLVQRKLDFGRQWAALNELKKTYCVTAENLKPLRIKFLELLENEQKNTRSWRHHRNMIMSLYNELNPQLEIPDPREVLGGSQE